MQNRITDKDSFKLSDDVYDNVMVDELVGEDKFKVLAVENNINNGMKAMAVAPVDENGNVDKSKVIIAYAGTGDLNDVRVDRDEVVFGFKYPGSQIDTSEKFAKKNETGISKFSF